MRCLVFTAAALLLAATSAHAQEAAEGPFTVSGSFALVSDYRFRGVSQTDEEMALQGGVTVAHASGFYAGTWASNLAGWGTFGGANIELDLFGGYKFELTNGVAIDAGLLWYFYPGGADDTSFAEPYVKVSGTVGPASVLAGVAYAPKQKALGNFSATPQSRGQKQDNLYIWGDVSGTVPGTPVILKAHLGYSDGNPGLGPNGTSVAPTGKYLDWMIGADVPVGPITLGVAYIDTDISRSESAYLLPNFSNSNGSSIADSKVVFSLTAAF
ncbi:MAG: TorF family putative porin [Alphaproteobacteria bacterium]|nr:TorF family putative porin [Alphaproteobacteria bacterium]MBU1515043.1 TorF family putative porin [Alphaproteobacteria bacterium]MBU2095692.1 TorF family putative porin [Alphaproteobacteria bacterium]MBU2152813.1 TorF family putative porin [Alphaproteobacteria bacterium]MBU2306867.1 TorF family putative porin [Alphaproteobacteria bacterium]